MYLEMWFFLLTFVCMKEYFAKYLPVEGEIKEAKFILYNGEAYNHIPVFSNFKDKTFGILEGQTHGIHIPIDEAKIAKLFLCSRDIKAGDEVLVEPNAIKLYSEGYRFKLLELREHTYKDVPDKIYKIPFIETTANPNKPELIGTSRDWLLENLYTVIGEISPKAKWVKEGDEFDEEEISFRYTLPVNISNPAHEWIEYPEFAELPTDEDISNWVNEFCHFNGGRGGSWELSDVKVSRIKIKCSCCNTFI